MKVNYFVKAVIFLCMVTITTITHADESGRAKIWFDIPGSSYVGENDNPWLLESLLTTNPNFTLNVKNMLDSSTIYDAHLVLAIPPTALPGSWSIQIGSTTFGYSDFSNTGDHTFLARHGVYGGSDGAKWAEFTVGDIGALGTVPLSFTVTGDFFPGFLLHLDAYGSSLEDGQDGRYFAPYSHDANFVPEPISAALFLLGVGALAGRQYRKKRQKV